MYLYYHCPTDINTEVREVIIQFQCMYSDRVQIEMCKLARGI